MTKIPVIDANILIHGKKMPNYEKFYTTPSVMNELESDKPKLKADNINLEVKEPEEKNIRKVNKKAREINSPTSTTDNKIVALGLQLSSLIISDDKAVQNLCLHLNMNFDSFLTSKIKEKKTWSKVCNNCGSKTAKDYCQNCGSQEIEMKQD